MWDSMVVVSTDVVVRDPSEFFSPVDGRLADICILHQVQLGCCQLCITHHTTLPDLSRPNTECLHITRRPNSWRSRPSVDPASLSDAATPIAHVQTSLVFIGFVCVGRTQETI